METFEATNAEIILAMPLGDSFSLLTDECGQQILRVPSLLSLLIVWLWNLRIWRVILCPGINVYLFGKSYGMPISLLLLRFAFGKLGLIFSLLQIGFYRNRFPLLIRCVVCVILLRKLSCTFVVFALF